MHLLAQSLLRRLAAVFTLLVLARPTVAAAQPVALDASAVCLPGGTCDALRISLALPVAAPAPLSIATLRLTLLSPGWSFVGGPTVAFTAEDALGLPFGGTADLADAGGPAAVGPQAFIDFLAQGSSFELFPGAGGFLQLVVSAGADPVALRYEGTDFAGAAFDGTIGAGPIPGVVPEPTTLLLLAGGLAVLVAHHAARRRATA